MFPLADGQLNRLLMWFSVRSGGKRCCALCVQSNIFLVGIFATHVHVKRKLVPIGRERSELLELVVYIENQGARVL